MYRRLRTVAIWNKHALNVSYDCHLKRQEGLVESTASRAMNAKLRTLARYYEGIEKLLKVCKQNCGWHDESYFWGSLAVPTFTILLGFLSHSHPISLLTWVPPCPRAHLHSAIPQGPSPVSGALYLIADLDKPGCFAETWQRKPSGSQLLGPVVLMGFAKTCDSCLTPPLLPPPLEWCYQCWHSDSHPWNIGQWLHHNWVLWAILSSLETVGTM